MNKKRILALAIVLLMLTTLISACGGDTGRKAYVAAEVSTNLPRNETLFFGGLQWQEPNGWSPLMGDTANWANDQGGGGSRTMMFETPYMYNGLDDKFYPLLADGAFTWNADYTELTYKIKPAAYWSDATKITAHDAQATWDTGFKAVSENRNWTPYIQSVTAKDDTTVVIKAALTSDGRPTNYKMVETFVGQNYILQKAWLEKLVERNGGDAKKIDVDPGEDIVWSGPYTRYFADNTRVVLIRDDGYWGQHKSMWGKLPAPKYLSSNIYSNNDGILAALQAGEIDVSQSFISNVNKLWEEQGLPISTYIDKAPYHLSANMPTAFFNMTKEVLQQVELRKAIAIATDYDAINANAVTGQSPTFAEVPRSLMNPTPGEQALYNKDAVKSLQWTGKDIAGANKLLDDSGKFPKGDDGWRTYNGTKVSLVASCPMGWSDWEAALEIVAAAGKEIGIEITTNFVQEGEFYDNVTNQPPSPDTFDIFMMWTTSISPTGAWDRTKWLLASDFVGLSGNWSGANYSQYINPRADEIVKAIPLETDAAKIRELYTEAVTIYLTDVPSFSLMYRPDKFHTVYEGVWTGYTEQTDGRNVPPFNCVSGYAIADLYNLKLVGG